MFKKKQKKELADFKKTLSGCFDELSKKMYDNVVISIAEIPEDYTQKP